MSTVIKCFPLGTVGCRACSELSRCLLSWKAVRATNQQNVVPAGGGAELSSVLEVNWCEPRALHWAGGNLSLLPSP